MTFAAPWMLLGLLAIGVPVAVHLINRRRAQRVRFPAMRLLLQSKQRVARGLKLKQWLLLALRVGVFGLLPLAMAQPLVRCGGGAASSQDDRLPASVAVVVDDSASLAVAGDGDDPGWQRVAEAAGEAIDRVRSWDRSMLVFTSGGGQAPVGEWSDDRGSVRRTLEGWRPGGDASGLEGALALAGELHGTSTQPSRRTVIVTDDTARAWAAVLADPARLAGLGRIEVIDVGAGGSNVGVTSLTWSEVSDGVAGEIEVRAEVGVWGGAGEVAATLEVDDVAVGTTLVAPDDAGRGVAVFRHVLEGGAARAVRVRVDDGEGPAADDVRLAWVRPQAAVRVLVVNGDARSVQYNDEAFYLTRALAAASGDDGGFEVEVVAPTDVSSAAVERADVVVLANVASLPASRVEGLAQWVEAGGGVLITAGDQLDEARWSALLAPLLPRAVRSVTELTGRDDPDAAIKATRLAAVDGTHPVFRGFDLPGGESLQSALVYRYVLLEPSADAPARTLASWGDGGPALVERRIGRGGVLLWTTTIDWDWTDLPIRTTYLPLVRRMVEYLAQRGSGAASGAEVGSPLRLDASALGAERLVVASPSGGREVLDVEDGAAWLVPSERGVHEVSALVAGAEVPAPGLTFVVNAPSAESDVTPTEAGAVPDALSRAGGGEAGAGSGLSGGGRAAWPVLLLLALVVVYVESAVSVRRRVWGRLRARWVSR